VTVFYTDGFYSDDPFPNEIACIVVHKVQQSALMIPFLMTYVVC